MRLPKIFRGRRAYLEAIPGWHPTERSRISLVLRHWKQRRVYGFDDSATWSLDWEMLELAHERLRMFEKFRSSTIVDTPLYDSEGKVAALSVNGAVRDLIKYSGTALEAYIRSDLEVAEDSERKFWHLWVVAYPRLWW